MWERGRGGDRPSDPAGGSLKTPWVHQGNSGHSGGCSAVGEGTRARAEAEGGCQVRGHADPVACMCLTVSLGQG